MPPGEALHEPTRRQLKQRRAALPYSAIAAFIVEGE